MRVYKDFNNIPAYMKPKELKKGEFAHYKFFHASRIEPISKKRIFRQSTRIRTKDRIKDWKTNEYYDIGVFDSVQKDENGMETIRTRFAALMLSDTLTLAGGNIADQELYEHLELTNENASNNFRDESIEPQFERLDFEKEAIQKGIKADKLTTALVYFQNMTEAEVRAFAAAMTWDERENIAILKASVADMIMKDPVAFTNFIEDGATKDKGTVKWAISNGIIKYNQSEHKMYWPNDQVIAALDRVDGKTYLDIFVDWTNVHKNGPDVMTKIRKAVNTKISQNEKERKEREASQKEIMAEDSI